MRNLGRAIVVSFVLMAAMGCGSSRPAIAETESPYVGPIRSSDVARGRTRYHVVCGTCHDARLAPVIFEIGWSAAEVRHQVREGSALMPPIRPDRLSDHDLEALLAFFVTTGTVVPEPPAPAHAALDAGLDAGPMAPSDAGMDARREMARSLDAGWSEAAVPDGSADGPTFMDAGDAADPGAGDAGGDDACGDAAYGDAAAGPDAFMAEPDAGRLPRGRDLSPPSPPAAGDRWRDN